MKLKILSSGVEYLHADRLFYDEQGEGLGQCFFDSLFSDIDCLALYAGIHPRVFRFHCLLPKRFPYAVHYALDDDLVVVWRVLDLRCHPDRIPRALENRRTSR